ncbi:hypothetical protein [Desulfosporosinus acididurans]|uniref:hypothetical protein n=1 Tax=Desulfosporosinus acididurans TaxID=476652 RepID=UPI001A9A417E|nr:hypothetical protein [Desulfosporosinus acididurans]
MNLKDVLLGTEKYSFIKQDEIIEIINKNITRSMKKEILNEDIATSIDKAITTVRVFNIKLAHKEIYDEFTKYINDEYGFNVDISSICQKIIETAEERYVYLMRQTERENRGGDRKNLSDIASELGVSKRQLQKDIKAMTEQGFKLLGLNIKLVDERQDILKMESTPHPVILMQNISQLVVLLEGLRSMETVGAYRNSANTTAVDIWNQLTEYAREKILDVVEKIDNTGKATDWYFSIDKGEKWQGRFLNESETLGNGPKSQLIHLMKSGEPGCVTYIGDDDQQIILQDCVIKNYFIDEGRVLAEAHGTKYEIQDDKILEAYSIFQA